jgi:hypothetical protein
MKALFTVLLILTGASPALAQIYKLREPSLIENWIRTWNWSIFGVAQSLWALMPHNVAGFVGSLLILIVAFLVWASPLMLPVGLTLLVRKLLGIKSPPADSNDDDLYDNNNRSFPGHRTPGSGSWSGI